jgi:hypothetical protein
MKVAAITLSRWSLQAARFAIPLTIVLLMATAAAACPTCKDGLDQNDPKGQAIAAGFYYSILFMMAMPFAILATFGGLAFLSVRRAQRAHESGRLEYNVPASTPTRHERMDPPTD